MKLSQIKLSGFKSFVDHTVIDIKGQLVGIVGPNGCGKSNVIDAVRWVLGESSAKQLRGESMNDIIFNGSISRKAVSRASVELVFDNQQKILSNAWNTYTEISIKRVLGRNGESVYYINNQVVRRKDITELFLGTGVGAKGYAVIEQGMISRIIDAKPEDMRMYLEEAAGVSKYREKRKETLSRLEYTKENLVRLEDIKTQLSESIEKLTIQALEAKNYQELSNKLTTLQLTQILVKTDKANSLLAEVNQNIYNYQKNLDELVSESEITNEELFQLEQNKAMEEYQLQQLSDKFNQLRLNLARLEERKVHNLESIKRNNLEKTQLENQMPELKSQLEILSGTINDTNNLLLENENLIKEKEYEKNIKLASFSDFETKYLESNQKLTLIASKLMSTKHNLDLINNTLHLKKNQVQTMENRLNTMQKPDFDEGVNEEFFILKEQIGDLKIEIEASRETLYDKRQLLSKLELQKTEKQKTVNLTSNAIAGLEATVNTLDKLLKQATIMQDLREIIVNSDKLKPIWQGIKVKAGYEIAVEVALGSILSAVGIESFAQILKVPDKKLVIWHGYGASKTTKALNSLANYVEINDTNYSPLIDILNQFSVAANFEQGQDLLKSNVQKIVTEDGHLITNEYVIFNAHHGNSHILEHQNQLDKFVTELGLEQNNLELSENELITISNQIKSLNQEIINLNQENSIKQKKEHELQVEYTKQEQINIHKLALNKKLVTDRELLIKEIQLLSDDITHTEDEIIQVTMELELLEEENSKSIEAHANKEENYKLAKSQLNEIEISINQLVIEKQLQQQRLNSSTTLKVDKESQLANMLKKLESLSVEEIQLKENHDAPEVTILQEELNQLVGNIEEQKNLCKILTDKLNNLKQIQSKQNLNKSSFEEKLNGFRLKQQEYVLSIENLEQNIQDLNVGTYSKEDVLSQNTLSLSEIHEQILKLKAQIDLFGLVNLKAIEDLDDAEKKYESLNLQIVDLESANNSLETAINQIDGESRKLLNDTYDKVNQSFNTYFKLLFGGGQARLQLTDSDILIAGVNIYAEPLGKKNTSLHLLSGGEKALTAMSLVFALFSLNPAPFCLLDEVDAPLDDANTVRFCKLVKELSAYTQFVYISHNRLTMEMAHQLVGVTMQEKGVSTTVSVSLIDAVKHAS